MLTVFRSIFGLPILQFIWFHLVYREYSTVRQRFFFLNSLYNNLPNCGLGCFFLQFLLSRFIFRTWIIWFCIYYSLSNGYPYIAKVWIQWPFCEKGLSKPNSQTYVFVPTCIFKLNIKKDVNSTMKMMRKKTEFYPLRCKWNGLKADCKKKYFTYAKNEHFSNGISACRRTTIILGMRLGTKNISN